MSVFGDFQRVWVQRFPDSALPAAWEEDVRANLVKHKQKVTALREELEKEEFYVEYLERLLADVERHKQLANSTNATLLDNKQNSGEPQSGKHVSDNIESANIGHCQNTDHSPPPLPVREDISKFQDKCVSELSSTLGTNKRPKSEIPRSPEKVPETRRNSDPDVPSNYVTVIEVTGSSKKDKTNNSFKEEDEKESEKAINEDGEDGDAEASEEEPYYDSVALDQTGEYVYIDARVPPVGNNNATRAPPRRPPSLPESPGNQSNYVNIDYFIQHRAAMDSEDEEGASPAPPILLRALSTDNETGSSDAEPLSLSEGSLESPTPTTPRRQEKSKDREDDRTSMVKCIVNSVVESEAVYVECLNVMLQYMKAIRATLTTSQPVISEEEFGTMFYKIPELHKLHQNFIDELRKKTEKWDFKTTIGEQFKIMASNIGLYGAFLHNYARATDTVRRCSAHSTQFGEITRDIRLRGFPKGPGLSLEDLLHKPVARVQKNALVLHDLLKHTPMNHADHAPLSEALAMTRNFLDEFNIIQTKSMFPSHDRAQRRLVKNSFVVELSDGHRKLRHLFLFNDVIACAKYKASGRDKFTFELKWYVPVAEAVVTEDGIEPRETSPANVVALRSQACTVRDQILWEERNDEKRIRLGGRGSEKNRKKLAELEAQLVLASPNLVMRVAHKNQHRVQNAYTFFLSSEFERSQWIEAVEALQQGGQPPGPLPLTMYELQAWVTACRTYLQTDMGSYLLRSGRDESLLLGDLHLTLLGLTPPGLDRIGDLYIIVEVDSYGHYFKRAKSRVIRSQAPTWGETFVVELEGSQNVRILLYEECGTRSVLRGKCIQRLSRSWLQSDQVERSLSLGPATLDVALRFVPSEVTLRRVPSAKPQGLFGARIQQVCKREKRDVPFIITACVREVERRGVGEVGLYRVSGSASDLTKLRKSFESNSYEAEQLLKEVDVHSVTGVLKLYLREMPEALFTDALYPAFLEAFQTGELSRSAALRRVYEGLPSVNKAVIDFLLAHLIRVNKHEGQNKMSLHNLATVFGPTLLRPGTNSRSDSKSRDPLAAGTVDVMAQAGILYCFLQMHMQQLNNQSL
ncbi:active breakpoint cluster region-related protein [Polistes fuscatus]|uniref:active breakpoint cluster region-related protein n=1 Tax=Polistes fuscatus TaxID=30207 RepID=UPI001CA825CF|nr:active breakpoint cluster region-related protein [Polistes fuscatus]XP_043485692.1 active breakpoint cluster region-related protein [Polistes fuscatus]XP_043485693.1 active breakpoint cluster region-related protein [Polistes fuscatus]XP_043485694.1 active breakpoint cluster region-related protein [Polistes fuscatus]XP_043485695.1 active breakpoint cluster region-related protein [Polistes fuscatus]